MRETPKKMGLSALSRTNLRRIAQNGGRGIRTLEHFRVAGFQDRTPLPVKCDGSSTSEDPENVLAHCLALLNPDYPDLAGVLKVWPLLDRPLKAAILAVVTSTLTSSANQESSGHILKSGIDVR